MQRARIAEAGLHLAAEAGPEVRVVAELRPHDLESDDAGATIGEIDGAHAADAQPGQHAIATDPLRITCPQLTPTVRHAHPSMMT